MPQPDPYGWLDTSLKAIHRAHRYRSVQTIDGLSGPVVQRQGQSLVNFASNDYLGLASHPQVIQAAVAATQQYGTGSTGSRLLSGHRALHRELEGQSPASSKPPMPWSLVLGIWLTWERLPLWWALQI
jgi:8-amino-7-oxononanoate synthase